MHKLSDGGLHFIASFEGYRPRAYDDAAAPPNATIGYGHELHAGPVTAADARLYWNHAKALAELRADAAAAVHAVNELVKVRLGVEPSHAQARFDMLVSFCFNVGAGNLACSHLLREINQHGAPRDWTVIAPFWKQWVYAGNVRLAGLERRRAAELSNFLRGRIETW